VRLLFACLWAALPAASQQGPVATAPACKQCANWSEPIELVCYSRSFCQPKNKCEECSRLWCEWKLGQKLDCGAAAGNDRNSQQSPPPGSGPSVPGSAVSRPPDTGASAPGGATLRPPGTDSSPPRIEPPPTTPATTSSSPPRQPDQPGLTMAKSSGVMTWSGQVEKNGVLIIDGLKSSAGALTGDPLPGVPVILDVDTREFALVEVPAPSNGWKRLTIRSRNSRHTVITLKWTISQ
jgi:hypothetical protein